MVRAEIHPGSGVDALTSDTKLRSLKMGSINSLATILSLWSPGGVERISVVLRKLYIGGMAC